MLFGIDDHLSVFVPQVFTLVPDVGAADVYFYGFVVHLFYKIVFPYYRLNRFLKFEGVGEVPVKHLGHPNDP